MNRKERRRMERQLGLSKHRQNLPLKQRLNQMSQNILDSKKKNQEMAENVRKQRENHNEAEESNEIASIATTLTITEDLSYYEALEKAKEIYRERKEKQTS